MKGLKVHTMLSEELDYDHDKAMKLPLEQVQSVGEEAHTLLAYIIRRDTLCPCLGYFA